MNLSRAKQQTAHDVTQLEKQNFMLQKTLQKIENENKQLSEQILLMKS